jgi:hypothetical protein
MSAPSGFLAEMTTILFRLRPRGAALRSPDDMVAERLLSGLDAWPDASPSQQALAHIFEAASRPGTGPELSGEAAAVDAFLLVVAPPCALTRTWRGKRPLARRAPVLATAITTALFAGVFGTAAAGALPAPLQQFAHTTFGAPTPPPGRPAPSLTGSRTSDSGTPTLSTTASHPAASPGSSGKTVSESAMPTDSPNAHATAPSSGSGNGNGNGGNGKGNGQGTNGTGNGGTQNGTGTANGNGSGGSANGSGGSANGKGNANANGAGNGNANGISKGTANGGNGTGSGKLHPKANANGSSGNGNGGNGSS